MEIIILKQIAFLTLILLPLFYIVYKVRNHSLFDLFGFILVIIAYVLIHHKFVFGHQYAFHDTLWTFHVFFSVIDQWIKEGFSIGWNPFMNGGEPLYLYSNYFLWAELFVISFLNKLVFNLPSEQLVNLFFTYLFLSYFTFSFILFSVIFKKSAIVFFPFTVLVFSGITQTTMAIPSLIYLHLTPLVFLSLYLFFRKKDIHYLFFSFFLICLSANHYVPNYIAIAAVFFTVSWYLSKFIASKFSLNRTVDVVTPPKINKQYLILILLASIMVTLPVLYLYSETTTYTSPTRGGKLGEVTNFTKGDDLQQSVFHPLHRYKYLLDMPVEHSYLSNSIASGLEYHHSVSYIGSIAVLFFLLAFVARKKGVDKIVLSSFIVTLAIIVYFSLRNNLIWSFMNNNIPFFLLRHSFPFANITTLLIIIISTFGFMYAIKSQKMRYATIVITLILSAYPVIKYAQYQNELPINLAPFKYPYERSLYSQQITPIAFDTTPLILKKQAAATHHYEDFIFFRKDEYDKLLKTRPNMVVGNLFFFAPKLKNDFSSVTRHDMKYIRVKYIQDDNPNHLQLKTFIPQDGYLIRKENFHTGWSAKVNNIETPIEKYAGVFQAVKVNKGQVVVDFEFKSLYPLLLWLHIIFVFVGYFIFFYYLIHRSPKMCFN